MDRNFDAAGGAPANPIMIEDDSVASNGIVEPWDTSDVGIDEIFRQAGIGTPSQIEQSSDGFEVVEQKDNSFDGYNFQNALRFASLASSSSLPDLPWEAPAWKCIFDDAYDPLESFNPSAMLSGPGMPNLPKDGDELKEALLSKKRQADKLNEKVPIFSVAVGHRRDISWEEKRESDYQRSLMKWTSVVLSWPVEWDVCRALNESETVVQVCEQLNHYFTGKAPATLIKRANSMIYFMEQGHKLGYIFPYSESELYSLLKVLKGTGQKASRLKGVMEALTFCRYVFNIEQLQSLMNSKRCHGVVAGGPVNKANQAAPLKVSDLVLLHETLETSDDDWNRLMSGACLFCVYARARWSDFIHGGKITLDHYSDGSIAYVEMDVSVHKTMFASARRFRYLNLAAPGLGVHGTDWVSKWMAAFDKLGIDPHAEVRGCVMPAPDVEGKPLARALESDEAGCWLRLLIGEKLGRSESSRPISSHSLKATMLSFAAKRGVSHQDRLSLGHHVHPYQMADVYARDAAARDLRLLDFLIREVRCGAFKPDESRAGRLDFSKRQKVDDFTGVSDLHEPFDFIGDIDREHGQLDLDAEIVETPETDPNFKPNGNMRPLGLKTNAGDGEDEAEGYVTTDSSSSDTDEGERELVQRQFYPPVAPERFSFVQHQKSKLLHYIRDGNVKVLACGRNKSASYVTPSCLRYDSAVCHACQSAANRE